MKLEIIITSGGLNPSDYEVEDFYESLIQTFNMSWTKEDTVVTKMISSQVLLHRIRVGIVRGEIKAEDIDVKVDNEDGTFTEANFDEKGLASNPDFWSAGNGILNYQINLMMELI
jgi:hypothetical protein